MKRLLSILFLLSTVLINGQILNYPKTEQQNIIDTFFNETVIDEYRWLESLKDDSVRQWLELQNSITKKELRKAGSKVNSYRAIDEYSYLVYDNPIKKGDYYFTYAYYNNVGVPALFCQSALNDDPSILVDPNFISTKDKILLKGFSVSSDSKLLAYQYSRNGSDFGEIRVLNIALGVHKKDILESVKFSSIAWKDDGFYYSKFPKQNFEKTIGQEIYYHKLGTEQNLDQLIFKRTNNPEAHFSVMVTSDEKYLILEETDEKKGIKNIFYIDFDDSIPALRPLITNLENDDNLHIVDNRGEYFLATTFKGGNNGMVIKIEPTNPRNWQVVIPEYESALLMNVKLLEDKIITIYQANRKQQIVFFDYQGEVLHALELPFGFSIGGLSGGKMDRRILFSYSGYTQPPIVYILDIENFEMKPLRATVVNFDHTQFETKELEYSSFDGTIVPLFIIYKKGLNLKSNHPTLLKAYGGFGSIVNPSFDPGIVHFLSQGGMFAFANIRGGGDKGKNWALDGRGINKQNSFDDFIAAAEFLIYQGYSSPEKLAITGASNGGLVVGVAMTQRPDLFKVAVPIVAPLDMVRFENFTIGHYHYNEYGTVTDSVGLNSILSYSPLHNVEAEINYPATLIMTSENDDRVPPFHSYKFVAKLQNREVQTNPILLRVEEDAGHYGATSSFKTQLREEADMYNFILYNIGN